MDSRTRTARKRFGNQMPVVYRWLFENHPRRFGKKLLDFGCGFAVYYHMLIRAGYDWYGYDLDLSKIAEYQWEVRPDNHSRAFDVVALSNVLNVQESEDQLRETVLTAAGEVCAGGLFVWNYPNSPRRLPMSFDAALGFVLHTLIDAGYEYDASTVYRAQRLSIIRLLEHA